MSQPEFNQKPNNGESSFDFLHEDSPGGTGNNAAPASNSPGRRRSGRQRDFPVIRRPVPVNQSGGRHDNDVMVSEDTPTMMVDAVPYDKGVARSLEAGADDLFGADDWQRIDRSDMTRSEPTRERPAKSRWFVALLALIMIAVGGLLGFSEQIRHWPVVGQVPAMAGEMVATVKGMVSQYTNTPETTNSNTAPIDNSVATVAPDTPAPNSPAPNSPAAEPLTNNTDVVEPPAAPEAPVQLPAATAVTENTTTAADTSPTEPAETQASTPQPVQSGPSLYQRFTQQLSTLEALVKSNQLDAAEQALANMDRSVYGYGVPEFSAIEQRIAEIRYNTSLEQEAAQRQAETEAAAAAARTAQQAEAAATAQAAEVERERQRVAAERERRQVAARERAEAARLADTASNSVNAAAVGATLGNAAEVGRSAQQREAQRLADAQATARQAAEVQARARQEANEQVALAAPSTTPTPATVSKGPITDAELQSVYGQFIKLENAVESRSINEVISLTKASGARIQQFLQLFENSESVDARILNVATSNATGTIVGTLRINRFTRRDGSVLEAPGNLSAIKLTSTREENGWSAISW